MRAVALTLLACAGCKGIQGGAIGAGAGYGVSGTPQGAAVGAFAGFIVGLWNDLTTAVSNWWHGLWGDGGTPVEQSGSIRSEIWQWILLAVVLAGIIKFIWHLVVDEEFRDKVIAFFKPKVPQRRRRHADQSP